MQAFPAVVWARVRASPFRAGPHPESRYPVRKLYLRETFRWVQDRQQQSACGRLGVEGQFPQQTAHHCCPTRRTARQFVSQLRPLIRAAASRHTLKTGFPTIMVGLGPSRTGQFQSRKLVLSQTRSQQGTNRPGPNLQLLTLGYVPTGGLLPRIVVVGVAGTVGEPITLLNHFPGTQFNTNVESYLGIMWKHLSKLIH